MMKDKEKLGSVVSGIVSGDMTDHIHGFVESILSRDEADLGANYFAIMASACYLESVLEEFSVMWCERKTQTDDDFIIRLMGALSQDISRATGLGNWKKWLKVLYDVDFDKTIGNENWKTLNILFKLRNQLAHGRTTKFTHFWSAETGKFLGMTTNGSEYEPIFSHLLKRGVISIPEGTVPSAATILEVEVVRYFWKTVNSSIESLREVTNLQYM